MVVHGKYLINLATDDKDHYAKSWRAFDKEVTLCEVLGIRNYVLHPGSHEDPEKGLRNLMRTLNVYYSERPNLKVRV